MNPDATVRGAQIVDTDHTSDPFFRAAATPCARSSIRACQPLKLPPDKYGDQWQDLHHSPSTPKDIT